MDSLVSFSSFSFLQWERERGNAFQSKKNMKQVILTGKVLAAASFFIGTILVAFSLYFGESESILVGGFFYTLITAILNSIVFLILIICSIFDETYRLELLKTSSVMLINIPIAIVYIYLVFTITVPIID